MENEQEVVDSLLTKYNSILLTRSTVSEILNVSTSTVDRIISSNEIGYKKFGNKRNSSVRISVFDIAKYIVSHSYKRFEDE